jgi:hypothetical protein
VAGRPQRRARLAAAGELVPVEQVRHGLDCGCQRCTGFEGDNEAHFVHGATSERHVAPLARNQRRRLLRQTGTRVGDLSPTGRALLEHYCRTTAKIVLIDEWVDEHGLIRDDGSLQPCMRLYATLTNTATRTLARLETHLDVRMPTLEDQLAELRRGA